MKYLRGILYPKGSTPLKWKEISVLFLSLFSTAMTITMLFPFLPAMVKHFGKTEEETGYYAGLIASSMFFGRCVSSYLWGILADKIGRKPVIVISLIFLCINTFFFGLSSSVLMAMITRLLVGLSNGVIGTSKAIISELCDVTNQSLGMSAITCSFTSGLIVGPALGGYLSETGMKYPETFPPGSFFYKNPFFLPCLVNCVLLLFSGIVSYKWLPETLLKSKKTEESRCLQMCGMFKKKTKESEATKSENHHNSHIAVKSESPKSEMHHNTLTRNEIAVDDGCLINQVNKESCKNEQGEMGENDDNGKNDTKEPKTEINCENDSHDDAELKHRVDSLDKDGFECQIECLDNNCSNNIENTTKHEQIASLLGEDDEHDGNTEHKVHCTNKQYATNLGTNRKYGPESKENLHRKQGQVGIKCTLGSNDEDDPCKQINMDSLPSVSYKCEDRSKPIHIISTTHSNMKDKPENNACCSCLSKKTNLSRILKNRGAVLVLVVYVLYGFAQIAIDELVYIWAAADPRLGGLGFNTDNMGTLLLIVGIAMTIVQPTVLPKIERRIGCLLNLQVSLIIGMFFSVTLSSIRIVYNRPNYLWPMIIICLGMRRMCQSASYLSIFLLVNNSVERELLCSVNGLGLTVSSLSKSIGPTVGGSLFSWSVTTGRNLGFPFNINMPFIFFGLFFLVNVAISCFISESLNEPPQNRKTVISKSVDNLLGEKA